MDSTPAFDRLAASYDADFTASPIARYLRAQVHARLEQHFCAGDHVLEFGCGTGEDALYLAQRGVRVTATDASLAMLEAAKAKIGNQPLVTFAQLDLQNLPNSSSDKYNGVFSNFGPLNVLHDWRPLAAWLAQQIKPGGIAAFGVMSPFCLWEMAWHGLHSDLHTATRRLRKKATFQTDKTTIDIYYPTIRRLTRDFAPHFRRIHVRGLGLFLPPSDVYGVIEKRPRLFYTLMTLEKRFAPLSPLALFADHYWVEFQRAA